jgi:hypothetical protein
VHPEQLFEEAGQRALQIDVPHPPRDSALERARLECTSFFDRIGEPPVYRRVDDPARRAAEALLPEGRELLARCIALERDGEKQAQLWPLIEALKWHLASLCHVADGRLEMAEAAWLTALERERAASASRRAWVRSDETKTPVFNRVTGASRFDPRPEPQMAVKLVCPRADCEEADQYELTPTYSTHRFTCSHCRRPFTGYFGEVRSVELTPKGGDVRRYLFRVQELTGGISQVEFEDASGAEFVVARRDLLALLYTPDRDLKAVLNLSSSRLLWVQRGGPCFVATAAFGDGAPELAAFRALRDRVLMRSLPGRAAIRGYYRLGPGAARWLLQHPSIHRTARRALGALQRMLVRRGLE